MAAQDNAQEPAPLGLTAAGGEEGGLARGWSGPARVVAFGLGCVAPAGSVVADRRRRAVPVPAVGNPAPALRHASQPAALRRARLAGPGHRRSRRRASQKTRPPRGTRQGIHPSRRAADRRTPMRADRSASMPRASFTAQRRRHPVHIEDFQSKAGDPVHEPDQGRLVGQLNAKGRRAGAHDDLAVVEFRAQHPARLAGEGSLISSRLRHVTPRILPVRTFTNVPAIPVRVATPSRVT